MTTVVRFVDAWSLWAVWTAMDILMAIFHDNLPNCITWDVSKWFFADFGCAFFLGWLWLTRSRKIPLTIG